MKPLLLGVTVYGAFHTRMFLDHCWPSLMSLGNLDALRKERDVGVIIHTDKYSAPFLKNVPFPILDVIAGEDKYEQLGRHQHYDLRIAKEHGADYHLLMPDFVYSENCFAGVLKAISHGHKAVARLVVSTVQEDICKELNPNMSAKGLATLSLKHIHPGVKHWFAEKDSYPNTHVLAWETKDTLRMCSPHCTPVYIANEVIKLPSEQLPLDCILDKVIEGPIYFPKPEDEIVIIELSPKYSRETNDKRIDLEEFVRIMKTDTKGSAKQLQIFNEETVDSINRSALGDKYWDENEIAKMKKLVLNGLHAK